MEAQVVGVTQTVTLREEAVDPLVVPAGVQGPVECAGARQGSASAGLSGPVWEKRIRPRVTASACTCCQRAWASTNSGHTTMSASIHSRMSPVLAWAP